MRTAKATAKACLVVLACAWVLWEELEFIGGKVGRQVVWWLHEGHPTHEACLGGQQRAWDAAVAAFEKQDPADASVERLPPARVRVNIHGGGGTGTYRFLCLPDTVDPRRS